MIEILGESVKSALGAELMRIFPGVSWYKESSTNTRYPHFFVSQLTLSSTEDRRGRYHLQYSMTVRYRAAETPPPDLQTTLDGVGLRLLSSIQTVSIGNVPIRMTGARYEKADGVLHFFCNILLQVTHEEAEAIKQQQMTLKSNLKREG